MTKATDIQSIIDAQDTSSLVRAHVELTVSALAAVEGVIKDHDKFNSINAMANVAKMILVAIVGADQADNMVDLGFDLLRTPLPETK